MCVVKREGRQATISRLEQIAREKLGLGTLETQRSDSLDFHELAVWQLRAALEAAFAAGLAAVKEDQP
jgi:hypothetical protein